MTAGSSLPDSSYIINRFAEYSFDSKTLLAECQTLMDMVLEAQFFEYTQLRPGITFTTAHNYFLLISKKIAYVHELQVSSSAYAISLGAPAMEDPLE